MRRWPLGVGAAAIVVLGVGLAALASGATTRHGSSEQFHPIAETAAAQTVVDADRLPDGTVAWDQPLRLHIEHGTFHTVDVTDDAGNPIGGAQSADGTGWQSAGPLVPTASYRAQVTSYDSKHRFGVSEATFKANDTDKHITSVVSPADGETVGVGMPVAVVFNKPIPVPQRDAVEQRLAVTATPAVTGAWHWTRANEVHWRPQAYWQPGTKVAVHTDLSRLNFGGGVWGADQHTTAFTIGEAHVSTADIATYKMTVTNNGQVVRVLPMSAGRDKYPTKGGVHIALDKKQMVIMDSQTVGIPRNSPDGYYEKVYWDVRISNGGAFVHAAPWSVGSQGHTNVSHGCVNVSTADAQWFYGFSRRGDIVNVVNSPARPDLGDPGTADWNIPWEQWAA